MSKSYPSAVTLTLVNGFDMVLSRFVLKYVLMGS